MKSILSALAVIPLAAMALAAGDDIEPVPLPVDADKVNFTGTWNYATSPPQVVGICPAGTPISGTMAITRAGDEVGVMITSGATCIPASLCRYSGTIQDGQLVVSTTAIVDDEGGSATAALRLFFTSEEAGGGESSSSYVHPEGFECRWSSTMTLWRSEPSK